jgi:protein pelota
VQLSFLKNQKTWYPKPLLLSPFVSDSRDQWHAYNLIRPNDLLRASAIRRVTTETSTGGVSSTRVHTTLTLRVTSLDFDTQSSALHVSGRVSEENKFVGLGSHHTLDLELQRTFTLEKADGWDSVALGMLKEAVDNKSRAQIWAVVMSEGLANICYITEHQTVLQQTVTTSVPKKRAGSTEHDKVGIPFQTDQSDGKLIRTKAISRFHSTLLETLLRALDISNPQSTSTEPRPLLLASPGFTAQNFHTYIKNYATSHTHKPLTALLPLITVTHSSSANLSALAEVLASPAVLSTLQNTKFARETQILDEFYTSLRRDDGRAWYGPKEVEKCVEKGAVGRGGGVLLISNRLFRAPDVAERKKWVALVDRVREVEGGEVRVLSEAHESGKRLETLGGVAAVLTFPLFDLDEDDGET